MNERIRELFKKAGGITITRNLMSNPVQEAEYNELWDDRIDRFAELIVRECAKICETRSDPLGYANLTAEANAKAIKEHFGVEE